MYVLLCRLCKFVWTYLAYFMLQNNLSTYVFLFPLNDLLLFSFHRISRRKKPACVIYIKCTARPCLICRFTVNNIWKGCPKVNNIAKWGKLCNDNHSNFLGFTVSLMESENPQFIPFSLFIIPHVVIISPRPII